MPGGSRKGQTISGHSKTMTSSITQSRLSPRSPVQAPHFTVGPCVTLCHSLIYPGRPAASTDGRNIKDNLNKIWWSMEIVKILIYRDCSVFYVYSHWKLSAWCQSPRVVKSHSLKTLSTFQTSNKINQRTKRFSTIYKRGKKFFLKFIEQTI